MKTFFKFLIIFFIISLGSCSDPIFYMVFQETPIIKPLINGSPTNFVEYNSKIYVASGKKVWEYDGSRWQNIKNLGGFVGNLTATTGSSGSLYVSYINGSGIDGRIIKYSSTTDTWTELSGISNVQSIHAVGDVLFACKNVGEKKYSIEYKKDTESGFSSISNATGYLNGVASDTSNYYLCTSTGIYCGTTSSPASATLVPNSGKNFLGIINITTSYIAAISADGKLYKVTSSIIDEKATIPDNDKYYGPTGALAVWYSSSSDTTPSLLLVGRSYKYTTTQTGYTNGYLEIKFESSEITGGFSNPGTSCNYDSYVSSLGKQPVNHMIQTPSSIDTNMTLFASTQQKGVWSYKDRGDGKGMTWNAERN